MMTATAQQALTTYLSLTTSLDQFGKHANDLDHEEHMKMHKLVDSQLALHRAIISAPEAQSVTITDHQVKRAVEELKQRFADTDAFSATLAENELDDHLLTVALQQTLHRENILDYVALNAPTLTNEEAEAYYFRHLKKFEQPERRLASHILITLNDDFIENQRPNAEKRIKQLANTISTETFAKEAIRHSECPTAMNNGLLGLVEKGQLHPPLDDALFQMAPGTISDPIETEVGLHLLYCQRIDPEHRVPFRKAKQVILEQHKNRAQSEYKKAWIKMRLTPKK